jgi:hypothetical protein
MYWYRDGSALSLLPWLLAMAAVFLAGWLIATHAFRLSKRERLIVGLGLGMVLYSWFVNIFGQFLSPQIAFSAPAILLLLFGLYLASRKKEGPWLNREDLKVWPILIGGLFLVWVFLLFGKGLALFDEQKNLSLISVIANGDIAPRFFLDYPLKFVYHYGFHIYGASLMRLGGMMPWSAFDLAKAIRWGISLLLAALLGERYVGRKWGGWLAASTLAFASGTRYLLFLLPPGILQRADQLITLQGTSAFIGKPFSEALSSRWTIDGGPPMDYIFGFLNGIMDPLVMAHQGPNTFSVLIFLLSWLLLTRLSSRWARPLLAILFSMWALAWEATYALFIVGLIFFSLFSKWRLSNLKLPHLKTTIYAALISIPMVVFQGGTITELIREAIFGFEGPGLFGSSVLTNSFGAGLSILGLASPAELSDFFGFSLRWPPAILSAHLGALNIFSPIELLVAFFEIGPVILFTPWISRWAWRRSKAGDWPLGVFLFSAWIGFLMPIFLSYQADRDLSRLSWQALLTWTIMLALMIADKTIKWRPLVGKAAQISLGLMVFGGLVITGIQFTAASTTQLAHTFTELDASLTSQVWGTFSQDAKLFGPLGNSTVITGQLTGQLLGEPRGDIHHWNELTVSPDLERFIRHDYQFVLIDSRDWDDLSTESQSEFDASCIEQYAEVWDNSRVNFRRILDLRPCYP